MIKIIKKFILISSISIISIIGLVSCEKNKNSSYENAIVNGSQMKKEEVKALKIEEIDVSELYNKDIKGTIVNKIENISDFDISNIWLIYNEIGKDEKTILESKMFLDMTLKPGDIFEATFKLKESSENINIISYEYQTKENDVLVNLKEPSVNVTIKEDEFEDSVDYEVLSFSDAEKVENQENGDTYIVKVKNTSSKNLGNIALKIAEVNKSNEYIKINHESSYSALKPQEEAKIIIKTSKYAKDIKIVGYVYDDIDMKSNIDIDLISNEAQITKY